SRAHQPGSLAVTQSSRLLPQGGQPSGKQSVNSRLNGCSRAQSSHTALKSQKGLRCSSADPPLCYRTRPPTAAVALGGFGSVLSLRFPHHLCQRQPNAPGQLTVRRPVHSCLSSSRALPLRLPGERFRSAKPFSRIVAFFGSVLRTSSTISSNVMASLPMAAPLA